MDALKTEKTAISAGDQTYLNHRPCAITCGIDAFVKSLAQGMYPATGLDGC